MVELSPIAHRIQLISGLIAAIAVLVILIISPGIDSNARSTVDKIKLRGYLNVLTLNSATTYYQDIDGPNGFEYQLATWFAQSLGVKARFVTTSSFSELYPELLFGTGDIAAAGMSKGESDFSRSVAYGPRYYEVSNQVLYRKFKADRPKKIRNLIGGSLQVISGTAHVKLLHGLLEAYPNLTWIEVDDIAPEELIEQVDAGKVDYILADSHEIALQRRYFPELRIAFEIGEPRQLRWAYNYSDDDSLATAIETFFDEIEQDGRLEQLIHRHSALQPCRKIQLLGHPHFYPAYRNPFTAIRSVVQTGLGGSRHRLAPAGRHRLPGVPVERARQITYRRARPDDANPDDGQANEG